METSPILEVVRFHPELCLVLDDSASSPLPEKESSLKSRTKTNLQIGFWFLLILLGSVGAAGGYGYWLWLHQDELLHREITKALQQTLPGWEISVGTVKFDWDRKVYLKSFHLYVAGQKEPLLYAPELVICIDRSRFNRDQQVDIRKIFLEKAQIYLHRDRDGYWNFQKLSLPEDEEKPGFEWDIREAAVRLSLETTLGELPAELSIAPANLRLLPSGFRKYILEGSYHVNRTGTLLVQGMWNLDSQSWMIDGEMNDITAGSGLMDLARRASPNVRNTISQFQNKIERFEPTRIAIAPESEEGNLVRDTPGPLIPHHGSKTLPSQIPTEDLSPQTLGIEGVLGVRFRIAQWGPGKEPEYKCLMNVQQAQVDNPLLPFPLFDLNGQVYLDNHQLLVHQLTSKNGETSIHLNGLFEKDPQENSDSKQFPGKLEVDLRQVTVNEDLRNRLPTALQKLYDILQPTGTLDLSGILHFDGESWRPEGLNLTAQNGTIRYQKYPVPIRHIRGTAQQQGDEIVCSFTGQRGTQPLSLNGSIFHPGKEYTAKLKLIAKNVLADRQLWRNSPAKVQKAITPLHIQGVADLSVDLLKEDPFSKKWHFALDINASQTSMNCEPFPLPLHQVSGNVTFSSKTGRWNFSHLIGYHGQSEITGSGWFMQHPEHPKHLYLKLTGRKLPLSQQLKTALPASLQKVWQDLSPSGIADLTTLIDWTPKKPTQVVIPEMEVRSGTMLAKQFPWSLDNITTKLSYRLGKVDIHSFSGTHQQTKVRTKGFFETEKDSRWRLRLQEVYVDDLVLDQQLYRAIPPKFQKAFRQLNPRGAPISLSGMLDFRGADHPNIPVTAAWDLKTIFSGSSLTCGISLKKIFGPVTARGTWDGTQMQMSGRLNLNSVDLLDHQLTHVRGPYGVEGETVTIGSRKILATENQPFPQEPVPLQDRLSARFVGGVITLDGVLELKDQLKYRCKTTLVNGQLKEYARRYMNNARNLSGVMTSWLDLSGVGTSLNGLTGRGQLRIHPAALYELPVMFQVFQNLRIGSPEKTAFKYALLDFKILRQQFQFQVIELVGDAISFRGRGWSRFDGQLALNLYSRVGPSRVQIPFVSQLLNQTAAGWWGVSVRGSKNRPIIRVKMVPELDDALNRFLGDFNVNPNAGIPRVMIPPTILPGTLLNGR